MAIQPEMCERLVARPRCVPVLRRAVDEFASDCGASASQLSAIALGVSEAVSNVVLHAYVGRDAPGSVTVDAHVHERRLHVAVCDEGIGMRSRTDSPGAGFGLGLIASVSNAFELADRRPGVCVRMTFAID